MKALESDANAFCERAKKYELLAVPWTALVCWVGSARYYELRNDCQFATRLETVGGRVIVKSKALCLIMFYVKRGLVLSRTLVVMDVVSLGWSGFTTIEGYAYNEYKRDGRAR